MRARGVLGCAVAAIAVVGALAACTSNPVGAVASRPAVSTAATKIPRPAPTTPPPTQDAAAATPVDIRCRKLVPTALARQLAPDLRVQRGWTPGSDDPAAALERLRGTTCSWTDDAGDLLEVSVAKPSSADAIALKNDLVERSNSVPTYGREAYFQVVDHVGRVDAFRGRTWIQVRSNRFFEPGDATGIMASVDRTLGFAPRSTPAPQPATSAPVAPPTPTPAPTN